MAATVIPKVDLLAWNTAYANGTALALDGTDGGYFIPSAGDERLMFMLINGDGSNATTVTIKKPTGGNSIAAVADLEIALTAGQTKVISIESNRFKATYGDDKGKILFTDSAGDTKVIAYQLP